MLALPDRQLVDALRALAEATTYQQKGIAVFQIEVLAKKSKSPLAQSFLRSCRVLDGTDSFANPQRRAREVIQNITEMTAEPESAPAVETPQPMPKTPAQIAAAVAESTPPGAEIKKPTRKLL